MPKTDAELDAVDGEEIKGTAVPASATPAKRNAFSELMSPKKPRRFEQHPPPPTSQPSSTPSSGAFSGRDGLGAYIASPTSFPPSRVIYHHPAFVAIHDLFPKSTIHTLLLPRDPSKTLLHPFDALSDSTFLASVFAETSTLKKLVASELRRRYGKFSSLEQARNDAMDAGAEPPLPPGRDWEKEVITGVHAHPSMNHLHIHVLSVDRFSPCLRHRKHYNSFSTPFLVPIEDFPLAPDDPRLHPGREGYLKWDFKCWRCGRDFGNKFTKLKEHLEEEFESWKRI